MAEQGSPRDAITRRRFVRDAGIATLAAADLLASPPIGTASVARRRGRPTVAVLGGGIAGLTAAHELAERGFDVTVYERRAWGGKARSTEVAGSAAGGRRPLPGEHGFRIFFGCYQNNPDTFRRIPFGSQSDGVFGNLTGVPQFSLARAGRRQLIVPVELAQPRAYTPALIHQTVVSAALQLRIPPQAAAYFADRMVVFLSSCDARRFGQWEETAWTSFIHAERWPGDYSDVLGKTFTHILQASRAEQTSARCIGTILEWAVYSLLGLSSNGPFDRILDAPTNEALIEPWVAHLRSLGVRLRLGHAVTALDMRGDRIAAAHVRGPRGTRTVSADWYVCALPVERARRLWTRPILAADPALAEMFELTTAWMNGIQLYLRSSPSLARGHIACLSSPWEISGILQAQFWARDFAATYGDGRARLLLGDRQRLGDAGGAVRQGGARLHARRARERDLGAAQAPSRRRGSRPHRRPAAVVHHRPGARPRPRRAAQRGPARPVAGRGMEAPPRGRYRDPEPRARRRLPARPVGDGEHGGCQRGRPRGRPRAPATGGLQRAAGARDRALPPARVGAAQAHRRRPLRARPNLLDVPAVAGQALDGVSELLRRLG
jgi:hypothetical protein